MLSVCSIHCLCLTPSRSLFHSHSPSFSCPSSLLVLSLRFCLCSLCYCYAVFILPLPGRMPHEAALLRWSHKYYNHLYTSSKIESVYSHSMVHRHASILCLLVKVHVYHFTFLCFTMQMVKGCTILYVAKNAFLEVSPVPYCISLLHIS